MLIPVKEAQREFEKYTSSLSEIQEQHKALSDEQLEIIDIYIKGITGELAAKLEKGKPCPVCGSIEHPRKAVISDNSVSKEEVEAKKKETDEAYKAMQNIAQLQEKANKNLEKLKKNYDDWNKKIIEKEAQLDSLKKNMVEGIDSIDDLDIEIEKLEKEISSYDKEIKSLEGIKEKASKNLTSAESNYKASKGEESKAEKKNKKAEEELLKVLKENGFEDSDSARECLLSNEKTEEYQKLIAQYDADLKAEENQIETLKKTLKDEKEPDEKVCRQAIKEIDDRKLEYETNKTTLNNEVNRLTSKEKNLKKEAEGLDEKIRIASEDYLFAKKLRGDSGTGIQRYVLGIMFSQVIASANKMLEMVHGGRYRLFRSEDKVQGTNKRGLDLKAYDSHSAESEGRFVSTMSGGEKFLASLALSIGMSTIAQKSGIKIDALFIDEGFGSLDEESIGDAMNVLNFVKESNGLVGIISHVQILQDQIPTKIVVEQKGKGSHITQTVG